MHCIYINELDLAYSKINHEPVEKIFKGKLFSRLLQFKNNSKNLNNLFFVIVII